MPLDLSPIETRILGCLLGKGTDNARILPALPGWL